MQHGLCLCDAGLLGLVTGSTVTAIPTTTLILTTTTASTTSPVVEGKSAAETFLRGGRNYATLQPTTKRSVGTETNASELDHYSDDEAPLATPRGCGDTWVSFN